jgi:hypothetical protein
MTDLGHRLGATPFERFREQSGRDLPALTAARSRTSERLAKRRYLLVDLEHDADAAVVLFGSWGRHEITSGSDDDYVVLVHGPKRDSMRPSAESVADLIAKDPVGSKQPGQEHTFGGFVFTEELINKIGLDRDTNKNLTQRALLMLESEWVTGQSVHADSRRAVIEGYLRDTIKDFRPPRFLLNDLVRYWRTIGVDFVAKARTRGGEGWGLRNAKLRTSRKMLFASGLLPVLRCHEQRREDMLDFLVSQYAMPPVDRLADAFLHYGAEAQGVEALVAYDQFVQLLDDDAVREELDGISSGTEAARSARFETIARLGIAIDAGILGLLFSPALASWTRNFAIL